MHKPFIQQSHHGEEHIDVSAIEGERDGRDESLEGAATVSPFLLLKKYCPAKSKSGQK
jgi:hypothetical protein